MPGRVLVVHPSAELYGSDRVALESVRALVQAGRPVTVALAGPGPLVAAMADAGAEVVVLPAPVLRKAYLSPVGLLRFATRLATWTPGMVRLLRRVRPAAVYVSTVTVPAWIVLARLARRPVVVHVHEAEDDVPRPVRVALALPLLLAGKVVANSEASRDTLVRAVPRLGRRIEVVYNGVPGPAAVSPPRETLDGPVRLGLVGRISPRKGTDVAVRAVALLRDRGVPCELDLVGGAFAGYEGFADEVRVLVSAHGLDAAVRWRGELAEIWGALAAVDVALVPSRVEPFGNAAVEAMLAGRPVVAGRAQGLREIVRAGENGEQAEPGDAGSLADAIARTVADWPAARARAERARAEAGRRFSPAAYRRRIVEVLEALLP